MRDWLSFWNSSHKIYVNDRHRDVIIATWREQIASFVPSPVAAVIDYGCGEATGPTSSPPRPDGSSCRTARRPCAIIWSAGFATIRRSGSPRPRRSPRCRRAAFDLIILNSVAQYLTTPQLEDLLAQFRVLLAPGGHFVIGDVIPPNTSAVTEVMALMKLAWNNGFVIPRSSASCARCSPTTARCAPSSASRTIRSLRSWPCWRRRVRPQATLSPTRTSLPSG